MRGKDWLKAQEDLTPGFLTRAYRGRIYGRAADCEVAAELAPIAALAGAEVTGNVVEKARLRLRLQGRTVHRLRAPEPDHPQPPDETAIALAGTEIEPAHPEQPILPGVELTGRGAWALYRELRDLRTAVTSLTAELRAARKSAAA
jgi:hypothetical protein